jgi:hypothetical protein
MPIPLGIFAVAGASSASAGAYELISTLSPTSTSASFTSIPSTYKHLQIRAAIRTGNAAVNSQVTVTFNSDSGANYAWHGLFGNGSNAASESSINSSYWRVDGLAGNNSTTNDFGATVIDILDYANTSKNKTSRFLSGHTASGGSNVRLGSGLWTNTSAISTITFSMFSSASFVSGTRISLYGIKG